ncbi:hypothetical protein ANME2D_00997 [Candidatus Methanoperedens nitroreducens]|uniref:Uncharacterized protein n=1 Tax=Candidatus Methanoperedens nitratireducens TaxID=1392998 RepID=A0A062V7N4_9EURY|nr:hypothetical protein [Candidatus Methanoperedens nitroreducens]KCZ72568.1 hypothetical protein ANME2D_00997 [Candidatus Methanoperedens nitroreducens]MDJ1423500.1 hypothetical protein [Candidatus Methanoperedens sp.]
MKKLYALVFALMLLLSTSISAVALESKTIYRQNGAAAYAVWSETAGDVYTDKFLSVTKTNDGTDIYVSICTFSTEGDYSCKWGYKFTPEAVFDINKKLESATLSTVQVDLYDWYSPAMETVTIQAQWTGTGDATKGSYKVISKYGDYTSKYSDRSTFREATATGSIDDQELGTSDFGAMVNFKSAYMFMKK